MLINLAYISLIQQRGETYEEKYQPIISKELFEKVQQRLKERTKPKKIKNNITFRLLDYLNVENAAADRVCLPCLRHSRP